jgi:hypothetical protein
MRNPFEGRSFFIGLVIMLVFVGIATIFFMGCINEKEKKNVISFYKSEEGKKARNIEAVLDKLPERTVILTHDGSVVVFLRIIKGEVAYRYNNGVIASRIATKEEFSRCVKEYFFEGKEKGYLLEKFLWNEKVPSDWKKNFQ